MTTSAKAGVVFTRRGAIYRPGNGKVFRYKEVAGTYYHAQTPAEVVGALETARAQKRRVRIYLGDRASGRDWLEEWDVEGRIGRSMGPLKVPVILRNHRSSGGPAVLDHCIVQIRWAAKPRNILYQHPAYHTGAFTLRAIGPDETCHGESLRAKGYTHAVDVDGRNHANFRSHAQALRFIKKMTG